MPINPFIVFQAAAPYCWCKKKHWCVEKRDWSWEIFGPCLQQMNSRRSKLLRTRLLMLDESMYGWRPKTLKLGGLPNYIYEPRKPVPLGTMFRNGVECISGILVFQDVVQNPELQSQKDFHGESRLSLVNPRSLLTLPKYCDRLMVLISQKADGWVVMLGLAA
jgi:hypothetical protein